jgi:spore coat protein U-like protein
MKMNMLKAAMAVALLAVGVNAHAGKASSPVTLGATLTAGCTVDTSGVSTGLGSYQVGGVPDSAGGGNIMVKCTNGTPYAIGIDAGANPTGEHRNMAFGLDLMKYEIYLSGNLISDTGLSTIDPSYAETTGVFVESAMMGLTGTGNFQPYGLLVAVYPATAGAPGVYSDTVNVVVAW